MAVASFGLETLSEVRAYVGGEGRRSKAQKNAIHDPVRYAATHEEGDYRRYLAALEVPHGDRRARLELDKPTYDLRVVREGFVAGGNSPEDTAGMRRSTGVSIRYTTCRKRLASGAKQTPRSRRSSGPATAFIERSRAGHPTLPRFGRSSRRSSEPTSA